MISAVDTNVLLDFSCLIKGSASGQLGFLNSHMTKVH